LNWKRNLTERGSHRIGEHLQYTGVAVLIAAGSPSRSVSTSDTPGGGGFLVVGMANSFPGDPEIGLLQLLALLMGVALVTTAVTIALVLLAIPPLWPGRTRDAPTSTGDTVTPPGIGMRKRDVVFKVELPIACR